MPTLCWKCLRLILHCSGFKHSHEVDILLTLFNYCFLSEDNEALNVFFTVHRTFIDEFKVNLDESVLVGLYEVVGFHKLEKILTFDAKFNKAIVK